MNLMVIDGNSIANRAYFGIKSLNAPDGTPTNAIFGFLNILDKLIKENKPDAVCVAFDKHAPTFRHLACSSYKANRKGMPDELKLQMPILKEILRLLSINIYEIEGYEADDILGTISNTCCLKNWNCTVVTGDKDTLQLINDKVSICNIKTKGGLTETIIYTPEIFNKEYGFNPINLIDLKSLMGDSSDNIPGVSGVGEKTALELIRTYGSINYIYENINEIDIKDNLRNKLINSKESAYQSFWLATIFKDVPIEFIPENNIWSFNPTEDLYLALKKLGFNKLINKWGITNFHCSNSAISNYDTNDNAIAYYIDNTFSYIESFDGKTANCSTLIDLNETLNYFYNSNNLKIVSNLKDIIKYAKHNNIEMNGEYFDCNLAAYLLNPTASLPIINNAKDLYNNYYEYKKALLDNNLNFLYYEVELKLCEVLADMEECGFSIDKEALNLYGNNLSIRIEKLQNEIWERTGCNFNINSPKQLGELLFDKLNLPYGKKTKTGWSTNAEVLENLSGFDPIIDKILEYRMLTKLKSTYADGLIKVLSEDNKVHTNFQMTTTATGRLSSTEPNLQNIPIRTQLGSEIRKMFIPSKGNVLVDADYSQIELRLLAHISNDNNMISAFNSGKDFHKITASTIFNVPIDEVTNEMRSKSKAVNFGIIYGMSSFTLSKDIKVSTNDAKLYMDNYFKTYQKVDSYMKNIIIKAKNDGYVTTLFGRRRYIPELNNSNFNVRSFGERIALNMPIQGTSADIIKMAMIKVYNELNKLNLKAKLILQVHDELIIDCPKDELNIVKQILKDSMENITKLSVPLIVDVGFGNNWSEAHI